jgi:4-hydroxy-tetrahydrodipicolinate synthase
MFKGSYVAIVTPFTDDDAIDYDALGTLIEWHVSSKTAGLVVLGTTGESPTILPDEREAMIAYAVKKVAGRIPVIIGTGSNSTVHTIALTQQARDLGADAALVVTPYYNKPPQRALVKHFEAVARVGLPVIIYNVPQRTQCDILPETVMELAANPHIVAIKDASGDVARVTLWRELGCSLSLLSGDDASLPAFLRAGGDGAISVTANLLPSCVHALCEAGLNKDEASLSVIEKTLKPLNEALFCESNPIPLKFFMAQAGLIKNYLRLPLVPLSGAFEAQYDNLFKHKLESELCTQ